jgi:predicted GIY-YIG superfamily endonuclease
MSTSNTPQKTALYRHYDKDGGLLYIGISVDPEGRTNEHRMYADWRYKSVSMAIEWFDDRQTALEAERLAIKTEKPTHNVAYNRPSADQLSPVSEAIALNFEGKIGLLYYSGLGLLKGLHNKQTMFFNHLMFIAKPIDGIAVVFLSDEDKKRIIMEIGSVTSNPLSTALSYISRLISAGLITKAGPSTYVLPYCAGMETAMVDEITGEVVWEDE